MARHKIEIGDLSCDSAQSLAVLAGDLVFTSGITAAHSGTRVSDLQSVPIEEQTAAIFEALDTIAAACGSGLDQAAKAKAYLSDMALQPRYQAAAKPALAAAKAAQCTIGADARRSGELLAVEIIAGVGQQQEHYSAPGRPDAIASRIGPLVLSAGCGPFDADGALVGRADLRGQATQALANLKGAVEIGGASIAEIAKVNNTAGSWHNYTFYNEIYNGVFAGSSAARCSVSGALTDPCALIEVEAVAVTGATRRYIDSVHTGADRIDFSRDPNTIYLDEIGPCKGPHTHGARVDDLVFIAGECPYDSKDRLVGPGDIAAQTHQTLQNVRIALEALGAELGDVVRTNVTLSDMRLLDGFERVYSRFFEPPYPARTVVATPLGQYGILVEIEAIAVVGSAREGVAVVSTFS